MTSLAPAAPTVNTTATGEPSGPTSGQLRRRGWFAFIDGVQYITLTTDDEKRGWMAALDCAADAETFVYLSTAGAPRARNGGAN